MPTGSKFLTASIPATAPSSSRLGRRFANRVVVGFAAVAVAALILAATLASTSGDRDFASAEASAWTNGLPQPTSANQARQGDGANSRIASPGAVLVAAAGTPFALAGPPAADWQQSVPVNFGFLVFDWDFDAHGGVPGFGPPSASPAPSTR